jgi:prophage antirepressor-like protein
MTPQMQLTLSSIFDGKNIRATEINGEIWIPVVDLADAWEVDRTTLTKIINKNPEIFKTLSTVIELPSSKEITSVPQSVNNSLRLVNERGTVILALKVSAKDLKNPLAKEKVIEFQLWVPQIIQDLRKGMVVLAAPQQVHTTYVQRPVDILNEQLDVADVLVKRVGVGKEQAHAYAVILAGEKAGTDLQCYATAIRAKSGTQLQLTEAIPEDQAAFQSHYSRRQIAGFLKLTEDKTRDLLEDKKIIVRTNGIWHLTKFGEQFGRVFMITPQYPYISAQEARIKYNNKLMEYLKGEGFEIPETKVKEDAPL